jgi:hypothetical protein
LGPFFNVLIEQTDLDANINKQIEVNKILQHLMRYDIIKEDIGTIIIINVTFGDFSFLIGLIDKINDQIITIIPFGQQISNLESE